ncbi:MAG: glycerol dehydratase reactivase beta/small subunit family protein [Deltaproteobacteria bacterium]|nr:MAG: glycerol dehydratase reactivase beta/small subunit family protein [Deltaproteobacteria bacterium]
MADAKSSISDEMKPRVWILGGPPVQEEVIAPIFWGLEEEGIPAEFREVVGGSAESLARQAAGRSSLNVGLGIDGTEQRVALHHRDLQAGGPLFSFGPDKLQPVRLRQLGRNAARLVKGDPLVFQNEDVVGTEVQHTSEPSHHQVDELQALIVRIVTELLQKE